MKKAEMELTDLQMEMFSLENSKRECKMDMELTKSTMEKVLEETTLMGD